MQTRLLACITGGLVGIAAAAWVNNTLGLSSGLALIVCAVVGVALGCVVSILFDVFATSSETKL